MRRRVHRSWITLVVLATAACGNASAASRTAQTGTNGAAETGSDTASNEAAPVPDGAASNARGRGEIELYPAARLDQIASELAKGTTTAQAVGAHPTYHLIEARRHSSGEPERHDHWVDVTVVQAGHATLVVGGRVSGDRLASLGEHRGGAISGASSRAIAAGDLFVIPAGVPHQYLLSREDTLRYLTIKVAQP